jgi:hypothetical protein
LRSQARPAVNSPVKASKIDCAAKRAKEDIK